MMQYKKQQGAALLTAILITAVVAVLASNILLNQHQWIAQTALADRQNNFQLVANRIQNWGFTAAKLRSQTKQMAQLPKWPSFSKNMQGIAVQAQLSDGNTLYNLNWLSNPKMDQSFARLITTAEPDIAAEQALKLAQAATVMLQVNAGMKPSLQQSVRPPEDQGGVPVVGPFLSLLQLKFIKGFNAKLIAHLKPYVSVLPVKAGINITTGNKTVLHALLKKTDDEDSIWMAYLSCREAFQRQHPDANAWQSCLQQNDGQNFIKNLGATNNATNSDQNTANGQQHPAQPFNIYAQPKNIQPQNPSSNLQIIQYRSQYAVLNATMRQTDLSSQIHAIYWMPNSMTRLQQMQQQTPNRAILTNFTMLPKSKVTLVSYARS